ncbi:hypothetical protein [Mycobacterium sp. E2462]|uniref:hypothetical protein n=1 Tax=Mycobacterium sp. E2462 TaxID=1834133 RepID=UPI0012E9DB70|nr:hypothetical protein [Mycobacterium sp. E2462]
MTTPRRVQGRIPIGAHSSAEGKILVLIVCRPMRIPPAFASLVKNTNDFFGSQDRATVAIYLLSIAATGHLFGLYGSVLAEAPTSAQAQIRI